MTDEVDEVDLWSRKQSLNSLQLSVKPDVRAGSDLFSSELSQG